MESASEQSLPPNVAAFSMRDLQFIRKFYDEFTGQHLRHLVHALCPSIFGHELIKVGPQHMLIVQGKRSSLVLPATQPFNSKPISI